MSHNATVKSEIVAKLKEAGYNSKMVSVSVSHSKIDATIRHASVSHKVVSDIIKSFEQISRCKHTNEILSGGNTYTNVDMSDAVKAEWAKKYAPMIEAVLPEILAMSPGQGLSIEDGFGVTKGQFEGQFYTVHYDTNFRTYNTTDVARTAVLMYIHSESLQVATA